eukprot:TRINITY_DN30915_c0_g1_i1.p1 TRINITY_DN30915_c0_g1~~TRINITY_DN30915_c0_g1_i1.p1  ORF type:complete len:581 (+),score=67.41 TRINITY_DN30915_c0_g1_i1:85-1827(+)
MPSPSANSRLVGKLSFSRVEREAHSSPGRWASPISQRRAAHAAERGPIVPLISESVAALLKCGTQCVSSEEGADTLLTDRRQIGAEVIHPRPARPERADRGLVIYRGDMNLPVKGQPLRTGQMRYATADNNHFREGMVCLYVNGVTITDHLHTRSFGFSPFVVVQACRLDTVDKDEANPTLRLFRLTLPIPGLVLIFALEGLNADIDRARWVADIARAVKTVAVSVFPTTQLPAPQCRKPLHGCCRTAAVPGMTVDPLPWADWTRTRILAGWMLMCDGYGVTLVYCELHPCSDSEGSGNFIVYEDEYCDVRVSVHTINKASNIAERVGVDCSQFILERRTFSTRTTAEKILWLRAISNVKVKLRHQDQIVEEDIVMYRAAIFDSMQALPEKPEGIFPSSVVGEDNPVFLPRRAQCPIMSMRAGGTAFEDEPSFDKPPLHRLEMPRFPQAKTLREMGMPGASIRGPMGFGPNPATAGCQAPMPGDPEAEGAAEPMAPRLTKSPYLSAALRVPLAPESAATHASQEQLPPPPPTWKLVGKADDGPPEPSLPHLPEFPKAVPDGDAAAGHGLLSDGTDKFHKI